MIQDEGHASTAQPGLRANVLSQETKMVEKGPVSNITFFDWADAPDGVLNSRTIEVNHSQN